MEASRQTARLPIGGSLYARAVLIDTGAFIALANTGDTHHAEAKDCLLAIARLRLPLFVSIPTIYETQTRLLFDLGPVAAERFIDETYDGSLNIVRTVPEDEVEAVALIARYRALNLTLVDAANMAVMRRLGIAAVFSFDRHYLLAGFLRIPPIHL